MSARKNSLGRNLNALLGNAPAAVIAKTAASQDKQLQHLPITKIQPGSSQPRKDMDPQALQELADSIKAQGIIQPLVVRPVANDCYEIIAGERRWRASKLAELTEVPVVIREVSNETAVALALIENIQREDLNPMEEAYALQRLQEEFALTHKQIAEAVGKSRTAVTNLLRLMSLNSEVKIMLEHGDLEMGHARALLTLPEEHQAELAKQIVAKNLSVRETEKGVRKLQNPIKKITTSPQVNLTLEKYQTALAQKLRTKVNIQAKNNQQGKIVIEYKNLDELQGFCASWLNE